MTERAGSSPAGFSPNDLVAILLINVTWGLNIVAVKLSVDIIAPFAAAFLRQMLVFLVCLPWLRIVPGKMAILLTLGALGGAFFFVPLNMALSMADNPASIAIAGQSLAAMRALAWSA